MQATPIALVALGAFVVLLSGGIDLSAGFAVGLCAVMIAQRLAAGDALVMQLLGRRNWWIPEWLERILPRLDVEPVAMGTAQSRP